MLTRFARAWVLRATDPALWVGAGMALASPALAAPGSDAEKIAHRIERVVTAMTLAARDADVGKYMTHIDADRPVLIAEHRAWATNLRTNPPTGLTLELVEDAAIKVFEDGSGATAPVTLSWTPAPDPETRGDNPDPISVSFPARFEPLHDPELIAESRWVFAGIAWEVELTAPDGSRVLAMEGDREAAEQLVEILPGALSSAAACFEGEAPVSTVKIYADLELLNAWISPGLTSPIGGWNEPGESIKLASAALQGGGESILMHEAAHAVQFSLGDRATDAPWWVLEGSAERAASLANDEADRDRVNRIVTFWGNNGGLADFDELAVYDERLPAGSMRAYIQGHHFVAYLDETFTPDARNVWLKLLVNSVDLDSATQQAFGQSFDSIDQSWRASLVEPEESDP